MANEWIHRNFEKIVISKILENENLGKVMRVDRMEIPDMYKCRINRTEEAYALFIGRKSSLMPVVMLYTPKASEPYRVYAAIIDSAEEKGMDFVERTIKLVEPETIRQCEVIFRKAFEKQAA